MNYLILKIVHITGLALTFMGLAGVLAMRMMGEAPFKKRWLFSVAHGLGLLLLLASGIAMGLELKQATDTTTMPGWIKAKFGIWLLAGVSMGLAVRFGNGRFGSLILVFFTLLAVTAAWLAIAKPF